MSDVIPSTPREGISEATVERVTCLVAGGLLIAAGFRRGPVLRTATLIAGGALILRAAKGHLGFARMVGAIPEEDGRFPWQRQIFVRETVAITKPREEVYAFWRNFENLPKFMRHLEKVSVESERLSHWEARGPAGKRPRWDAEVTIDNPNELIAWRSLAGSDVENSGEVQFSDAPGGRGTIVRVQLAYLPPAGVLGAIVARLFGEEPHGQIRDDLRRLRSILETGEVPTIEGQSSDRMRQAKNWMGGRTLGQEEEDYETPVPSEEAAR